MSNTTPPPIQAPTAKEKKYDRQLRLWAASGQRALEESHVLLIIPEVQSGSASSVAGCETLKNLTLPSVGQFTILDSAEVTEADLGINFFLEETSLGKSRAQECRRLLEELNPDVRGHVLEQSAQILADNPRLLESYNLILLCGPVSEEFLKTISLVTWQNTTPLIYIQSVGFYSTFSVQLPTDFSIVDTHPDPDSIQDLRLLTPWPELVAEVDTLGNIEAINDDDHGHIPYLLLLLHYLEVWKSSHSGNGPSSFKEKSQFRELVREGIRTNNPEGGEENYDEAIAAVLKTVNTPSISSGVRSVFDANNCQALTKDSSSFWYTAAGVKQFYENHGVLPLPGSLPDMKAKSAQYIRLQNIYKSKARADATEVLAIVRNLEERFGRPTPIPESEIDAFCKNAAYVKAIRGTRIPFVQNDASTVKAILARLESEDSLIPILLALQASVAGPDEESITELLEKLLRSSGKGGIIDATARQRILDAHSELKRAGGGELHNISAMTGGMVAQEAIKIITKQYVPVHNTCIFDGTKAKTEVFLL